MIGRKKDKDKLQYFLDTYSLEDILNELADKCYGISRDMTIGDTKRTKYLYAGNQLWALKGDVEQL